MWLNFKSTHVYNNEEIELGKSLPTTPDNNDLNHEGTTGRASSQNKDIDTKCTFNNWDFNFVILDIKNGVEELPKTVLLIVLNNDCTSTNDAFTYEMKQSQNCNYIIDPVALSIT